MRSRTIRSPSKTNAPPCSPSTPPAPLGTASLRKSRKALRPRPRRRSCRTTKNCRTCVRPLSSSRNSAYATASSSSRTYQVSVWAVPPPSPLDSPRHRRVRSAPMLAHRALRRSRVGAVRRNIPAALVLGFAEAPWGVRLPAEFGVRDTAATAIGRSTRNTVQFGTTAASARPPMVEQVQTMTFAPSHRRVPARRGLRTLPRVSPRTTRRRPAPL